jgi:hypothetical protein
MPNGGGPITVHGSLRIKAEKGGMDANKKELQLGFETVASILLGQRINITRRRTEWLWKGAEIAVENHRWAV